MTHGGTVMCFSKLKTIGDLRPFRMRSVMPRALLLAVAFVALLMTDLPGPAVRAAERPLVMGPNAGVSAGHPLTTAAAFEILVRGGNAFAPGGAGLLGGGGG